MKAKRRSPRQTCCGTMELRKKVRSHSGRNAKAVFGLLRNELMSLDISLCLIGSILFPVFSARNKALE